MAREFVRRPRAHRGDAAAGDGRTRPGGMGGISLLVVEKTMKGVETKRMDCMGVWASGTTFVTFDDVEVPAENLIGEENQARSILHWSSYDRVGAVNADP